MDLLPHIKVLLRDHDRAFIPGFGGFVKERVPARLQKEGHLFFPPGCTLHFNPQLAKEDGLLAEQVAESEKLSFDKARERVRTRSATWKETLEEKGRLELEGIGTLFRDRQGKTRFEPDPDPELDPSSYGLESFIATPVHSKEEWTPAKEEEHLEESSSHPVREEEIFEGGESRNAARTLLKVAAAVIPFLLLLAYGVGRYQGDERVLGSLAEWVPGLRTGEALYERRELELPEFPPIPETQEKDPPFSFRLNENGPMYTVVKTSVGPEEKARTNAPYLIVGGCFAQKRNAMDRVEELSRSGYPARILGRKRKGLHVVIFEAHAERRKAMSALSRARSKMPDAWLLHRSSL